MNELIPSAAPTAPTPSAPATPAAGTPTEFQLPISTSEAAMVAQWTKAALASGKISQEQADKDFADLNTPIDQRGPDLRTDEQKMLDSQFPPAKAQDFVIRYGLEPHEPMTPDMKQFDQSARSWLAGAEFPREVGNSLVNAIDGVTRTTARMNEQEQELYAFREYAKLERIYGDALVPKLQQAAKMVEALEQKQPGLRNLLKTQAIGDNALVVSLLIQQSERWHARRMGKAK